VDGLQQGASGQRLDLACLHGTPLAYFFLSTTVAKKFVYVSHGGVQMFYNQCTVPCLIRSTGMHLKPVAALHSLPRAQTAASWPLSNLNIYFYKAYACTLGLGHRLELQCRKSQQLARAPRRPFGARVGSCFGLCGLPLLRRGSVGLHPLRCLLRGLLRRGPFEKARDGLLLLLRGADLGGGPPGAGAWAASRKRRAF
jgi:hypothetical protein